MSKKMMLLALAVTAMLALPATASSQEAHVTGITNFTGHAQAGVLFVGSGSEPSIICSTTTLTGSFDSGSTTTGKVTLDFTGCTAEFLGIKGACNTSGAASGTIASSGAFHVITINSKPGILVTPVLTTLVCVGFSRTEVSGNVIGTITSPACGAKSNIFTVVFKSSGSTQEHKLYTGVNYELKAQTENSSGVTSGSAVSAGLTGTATVASATEGLLECT